MSSMALVGPTLDKARRDLEDAGSAMRNLWSRSDSEVLGQLIDCREAIEALTRALASVALAVERLAELEHQS